MFNKDASITVNGITYTNPKFYKGTNIIKSCECATRGCLDQEGLRTYINPEYDENGNIKSCESATKEYNGRDMMPVFQIIIMIKLYFVINFIFIKVIKRDKN